MQRQMLCCCEEPVFFCLLYNVSEMTKSIPDKKNTAGQWIGVMIYMITGAACGILMLENLRYFSAAGLPWYAYLLFFIVAALLMYFCMILQIIIHESGHLLFGLLTGYRFVSFRVFSFMILKEGGQLRLRHLNLAGTGGQCLMAPTDMNGGDFPVMLYNYGGAILNVISALLFLPAGLSLSGGSLLRTFFLVMTVIGIAFALINGLPLHMGPVNNDGLNAMELARDPQARKAFWIQMKVSEQTAKGIRTKDMPEEWFSVPADEELKNGIIAVPAVFACSRLMDEHRFPEADALMKHLLSIETGIVPLHCALLVNDRIYVELIGENRQDILQEMRTDEYKKLMQAMKDNPAVLRTGYAYALLAEKNHEKAEEISWQFEKQAEVYPYPQEILSERELMDIAASRAKMGV